MSDKIEKNKENQRLARKSMEVEVGEDSTKYGEFVSSYFAWIPLSKQKENAKRLQNITKKKEEKEDKKKEKEK